MASNKQKEWVHILLPPDAAVILLQVFREQRDLTTIEAAAVAAFVREMPIFSIRARGEEQRHLNPT
jgi:hypothetical protein